MTLIQTRSPGGATEAKQNEIISTIPDAGETELLHAPAYLTTAGTHEIIPGTPGVRIRMRYFYAVNMPTSDTSTRIDVAFGATVKFMTWGLAKRQQVTGAPGEPLNITLSNNGAVAVTILYEEIPA